MQLSLLLSVVVVAVAAEERQAKFFDGGFFQDSDSVRWQGKVDFSNLRDTMEQFSSSLGTAIDEITDRIDEQVEGSLPLFYRRRPTPISSSNLPEDLEGIDAISGTFGGPGAGVDDGLKIHINGDLEGVSPDGPFKEPQGPKEEGEGVPEAEVTQPFNPPSPFFTPFNPFRPFGRPNQRPTFNFFNFGGRREWWKGPNVCVDREEIDEGKEVEENGGDSKNSDGVTRSGNTFLFSFGNMQMTSCTETDDKYSCVSRNSRRGLHKTVIVTHRCCHGYVRDTAECTRVEMRDMIDTLQSLGTTDFLSLAKATGLTEQLEQNMTIFVPTNEALQEYTAELEAENELTLEEDQMSNEVFYRRRRRESNTEGLVLAHMTPGIHYASDLHDEQVLKSVTGESNLRINTYATSPPTATVNCARLIEVDQHTSNGVVHTIGSVLHPVTASLADLITSDPQFSILAKLVTQAGLLTKLGEEGQLTVFAPTDAAFRTLPELALEALLDDNTCLEAIIKNHLLPNVICSAAVQGKARTVTLLDSYLLLERSEDEQLMVGGEDGGKVEAADIMATNGVLHVIDSPLFPSEAKPVLEVLEGRNLTRFLGLLEMAGMTRELAGLSDVTIFAPSNRAIDELPEDAMERITSDPAKLKEILSYHIATPSLQASDITNNHIATTRSSHPLRINLYARSPLLAGLNGGRGVRVTAGCSRVSALDQRACGAVVHVVEQLLALPRESVMDHLEADKKFSIFAQMVKDSELAETLRGEGPFTVLAPSDHVFRSLPDAELNQLMEDMELKQSLIKQHVLTEHICCSGINPNTWLFMDHKRPLSGSPVHVRRTNTGRMMAGAARITHCAPPTHNGLVHTVNNLLVNIPVQSDRLQENAARRPVFSAPGLQLFFG